MDMRLSSVTRVLLYFGSLLGRKVWQQRRVLEFNYKIISMKVTVSLGEIEKTPVLEFLHLGMFGHDK